MKFLRSVRYTDVRNVLCRFSGQLVIAALSLLSFLLLAPDVVLPAWILLMLSGVAAVLWCSWSSGIFYLILLGVVTCFESHFIIHYGDSFYQIGTQALVTLNITDRDEIIAYLSLFKAREYLLLFLFVAGCVVLAWRRPGPWLKRFRGGGCAAAMIFLISGELCQVAVPVGEHLKSWAAQKEFFLARHEFKFNVEDRNPDSPFFCLLVIGESHRKAEFDELVLNSSRAPSLKAARDRGELWEFDDVITHYQQTWYSVFSLLSRRKTDTMEELWPEKGLIGLFKEAGWKTCFLTYQKKTPNNIGYDYVVNEADRYINHRDHSGTKFDIGMLPYLDDLIAENGKKKFVVMKMVGVHFHYASRYPDEFRLYTPCYEDKRGKHPQYHLDEKQTLVNTYCNAMSFNALFFEETFRRIEEMKIPAVMIFLSDHGVVNYDDGKNPFFGPAKSNFHIPCFIYGNAAFRNGLPPETIRTLRQNRPLPVDNSYMFDTIVSLSGLTYPGHRPEMDLTSPSARPLAERRVWVWKRQLIYENLP